MSATIYTTQFGATVHDIDRLPDGDDPDTIRDTWAEAVHDASEHSRPPTPNGHLLIDRQKRSPNT